MKTNHFAIISSVLLMMATLNVQGQTKKEIYEAKKANNDRREQQLKKRIEKRLQDDGVVQKYAEEGSVTAQNLLEWNDASDLGANAVENEQFEQAKVYVESLIPAEDYVIEIENNQKTVMLKSRRGFEAYTNSFSKSIGEYNANLRALQNASEEYEELKVEYDTKVKEDTFKSFEERNKLLDAVNKKNREVREYQKNMEDYQDMAKEQGETLLNNTTDPNLLTAVKDFMDDIANNNEVRDAYKNLKEIFKNCTDCGKN